MNGFRFKYGNALFNARIINYQKTSTVNQIPLYGNQLIINLSGLPVISGTGLTNGVLMVNSDGILCVTGDTAKAVQENEVSYNTMEKEFYKFDNIVQLG